LKARELKSFLNFQKKKYIQLVVTQITIDEIKSNFEKRIHELIISLESAGKKSILKNINSDLVVIRANKSEITSDFNKKLDEILLKSNLIILDYTEVNIKNIFENYFQNKPPFDKSAKKSEFPDAFSLVLIEKWCIDTKNKCILLSSDNDFLSYKNHYIEINKDYSNCLDNILRTKEQQEKRRFEILNDIYLKNSDKIDKELKEWYEEALEDEFLYDEAVNWFGIHNISVSEIEILSKDYKIIHTDEECIDIEVTANLKFTVIVTIDDQNDGIYDSEDKIMHYFGTEDEIIEQEDEAKLVLSAWIISDDEFDEDLEIVEVCKDKKIEINNNKNDYYWR
jgi:hypothetical protein